MTFAQAEGAEPLPQQLAPKVVSPQLRALLWDLVHSSMEDALTRNSFGHTRLDDPWETIMRIKHTHYDYKFADEFRNDPTKLIQDVKRIFASGSYIEVFGFLQWLLQTFRSPPIKPLHIQRVLEHSRAPYRVVDDRIIVPIASEAEGETLTRAFHDVAGSEFNGAQTHLRNAAKLLTEGKNADSIRESVHSVEAVARVILKRPKVTLGDALKAIEKTHKLHTALRDGFSKLYGYTNDESGIRHALIDDASAKVDETDAIFMLGACASFVSYLIARYRQLPTET